MSEASEQEKQEYSELVKEATPVHSLGAQMLKEIGRASCRERV